LRKNHHRAVATHWRGGTRLAEGFRQTRNPQQNWRALPVGGAAHQPGDLMKRMLLTLALAVSAALVGPAGAHGDVTPQAVDTKTLPQLGADWRKENPYRGNEDAIKIGSSGYNQNCARCHGLEAVSGGIAPDLRKLDQDCKGLKVEAKRAACVRDTDDYYATSVRRGKSVNGAYKMPPFEGVLNQEAVWAIKAYLETRPLQ
jgi:cytochrome c-550 PedF